MSLTLIQRTVTGRKIPLQVHEGVTLYFYPSDKPPIHVRLRETTAQDLVVDLGPPLRTHYKEDDRMRIHSSKKTPEEDEEPSCA